MDYRDWEAFKKSDAYKDYLKSLAAHPDLAKGPPTDDGEDPFIKDNFLSNELRIPVTLVGTYAGRALATNAMRATCGTTIRLRLSRSFPRSERFGFTILICRIRLR